MQHAACSFDPFDIPWILQKLLFSQTSFWWEDFLNISNHLPESSLGGLSLHLNHLYSIAHDNLRLAIWDTSFWTFWVKFGHKGP